MDDRLNVGCTRAVPGREHRNDSPRFAWDPTFAWFLLLFFLFNVGLGVFPPLLPQIMEDLQLSFAGAGLYRLVTDLGFVVAPGAVGWLIGACGFAMGSAVIAVALVAAIALSLCYLRSPHPA